VQLPRLPMIRHRPHHCNPSSLRFEGGPAQGTPVEDPRASSSVVCVTSRMNIARLSVLKWEFGRSGEYGAAR